MKILVTGGAGYIGSHTTLELLKAGHDVVVVDNLCNSSEESLRRVAELAGKAPKFYNIDIRDEAALDKVVAAEKPFDATIHFAALKAVGESTQIPLKYYENNLGGTLHSSRCSRRTTARTSCSPARRRSTASRRACRSARTSPRPAARTRTAGLSS